jgi:hypothetical protein
MLDLLLTLVLLLCLTIVDNLFSETIFNCFCSLLLVIMNSDLDYTISCPIHFLLPYNITLSSIYFILIAGIF